MAPKDNLTCVLHGIEDLRLEQTPIAEPADDEVQLEMDCVGICGTDIHYWTHGRLGPYKCNGPLIIGHESAGVVVKLGKKVTNFAIGDRVSVEPGVTCRRCEFCKDGRYHLCSEVFSIDKPPGDGNLMRYWSTAADFCHKLPDHVTMEEAAMLEPLSIAVHACKRADIKLGMDVIIFGAGPIGLMVLIAAKAFGASKVLIADLNPDRLVTAKSVGADYTLKVEKTDDEEGILKKIRSLMPRAPHVTYDCSGAEITNRLSILAVKNGGKAVLVGSGPLNVSLPIANAINREIDILSSFRCVNDFQTSLEMVASGKVNIRPLCTHHFDITDTFEAFKTSRYGTDGAIKVMIHVQPRDKNNPKKFSHE